VAASALPLCTLRAPLFPVSMAGAGRRNCVSASSRKTAEVRGRQSASRASLSLDPGASLTAPLFLTAPLPKGTPLSKSRSLASLGMTGEYARDDGRVCSGRRASMIGVTLAWEFNPYVVLLGRDVVKRELSQKAGTFRLHCGRNT